MQVREGDFVRITRGKWMGKTGYVSSIEDGRVCVEIIHSPNESDDICVPVVMVEPARH